MMDPMNRVNPDEVLPQGVKGCHPSVEIMDEIADFELSREELRQQVLDQRAIAVQQSQRAALAAKRGKTVLRRVPTTTRGRR